MPPIRLLRICWAATASVEEAIVNALLAAETMIGRDGVTAWALDPELLLAMLDAHGRRTYRV
jgi:D-aminopeptidase